MNKIKERVETSQCDYCCYKSCRTVFNDITTWEYEGVFTIVQCTKCGLVYLSPRPTKRDIGKYYDTESYWGKSLDKQKLQVNWKRIRDKERGRVYANIFGRRSKGKILDVGCGTGEFLTKFEEEGWEVLGTELSKDACLYAKNVYGLKVIQGDLLDLHIKNNQFDVVTFNSSLEHLYEPLETLAKAFQLLKNDGLIVITVPNIESLGAKIFGKKWLPLHPPKHLYHFSSETLSNILKKAGFKIEKIDHWHWAHSYYSIFETMRYAFSPKFKEASRSGSISVRADQVEPNSYSIKNRLAKFIVSFIATALTVIGSSIKKGETITVYAKKTAK
jgi:2-polyprenyl-3-methyl-5-hydroxy-6-metoxy-1,4-benzoquinol methylase